MKANQHRDYQEESQHLEETCTWALEQYEALATKDADLLHEIAMLRKEVSSALDERLVLKLQMQDMVSEDKDQMGRAKEVPYFGRVNFQERYHEGQEIIYIGKHGLYDSQAGEMLVLDWRAPMANIYYSGLDEAVSYETPKGTVEGTMHLKRRYVIDQGVLQEIHDERSLQDNLLESISHDAGFLIESLNKSTKGRLTEIVATIQDQQNKIIRSDAMVPLIVQGVAGSGKTTIALHRMAYMIYNQKRRDARYMVVAPNKLFLNYIEAILPDLGVDDVYQTTFEEWAMTQLGKKIKLIESGDKLNQLLTESVETTQVMALAAKLRGSIVFKKLIDFKLGELERSLFPEEGVVFEGVCICTRKELGELFFKSHLHLPLQGRIKQLGETLKKRLNNRTSDIEAGLMIQYQRQISVIKEQSEQLDTIREEIIRIYDERDAQIKTIKKRIPGFVKAYLGHFKLPSAYQFYNELFQDEEWLKNILQKQIKQEEVSAICKLLNEHLTKGRVESEDLGPLLYCQMRLYGLDTSEKFAHIVVDEAQDLDEMKLTALRQVSQGDAFTLVGDLSQGIYDYKGITDWERMMSRAFDGKKYHYYEMTTSYRSTIEIIALANHVILSCKAFKPILAQPVLRHGDKPQLVICEDESVRLAHMCHSLSTLKDKGRHSIGILVETKEQAEMLYSALTARGEQVQWIQSEEDPYEGGRVIMTGEFSKGLEFDAVIIYDVTHKKREMTSLDMKLLYVMTTRALHELHLYSIEKPYAFLEEKEMLTTIHLDGHVVY